MCKLTRTEPGTEKCFKLFCDEDEREELEVEAGNGGGIMSPLTLHPSRGRKPAASFLFISYIPLRGQRGKPGQCK